MNTDYLPRITPRDLNILEVMLDHGHRDDDRLMSCIRHKLRLAQIVLAGDMPANIVTIGSRVVVQVDDRPVEEFTLVTAEQYAPGQAHQSVASLRGVVMLGLAEGNCAEVPLEDRTESVAIVQVLYQPEADRRGRTTSASLRLISSREREMQPTRAPCEAAPSDDDPGPSAA